MAHFSPSFEPPPLHPVALTPRMLRPCPPQLVKEETLRNLESRLAAQSLTSPSTQHLGGGGPGTEY